MRTQHQPALSQRSSGAPGFLLSDGLGGAGYGLGGWAPGLHPAHPGYVVCLPGLSGRPFRRLWPPDKRGFPRGQKRCLSGGKDPRRSLLPLGVHPLPLPSPNPEKDTDTKKLLPHY